MPSKNPEIIKKNRDNWYKNNKDKQISRQLIRRREMKDWLLAFKKTQFCDHCGMSFSDKPECCDFHHLDPSTKEGSVADMVLFSVDKAKRELEKCICLCANCHRTVHKDMNQVGVATKSQRSPI